MNLFNCKKLVLGVLKNRVGVIFSFEKKNKMSPSFTINDAPASYMSGYSTLVAYSIYKVM